jgi:hypothetical protein
VSEKGRVYTKELLDEWNRFIRGVNTLIGKEGAA